MSDRRPKAANTAIKKLDPVSASVRFLLEIQQQLRLYHWQTRSYPRHRASDELAADLDGLADRFVEVLIGKMDGARPRALGPMNGPYDLDDAGMAAYLQQAVAFLGESLPEEVRADPALANIRDEMVAAIHRTLYKFTLSA